jgi:hypothetical protein
VEALVPRERVPLAPVDLEAQVDQPGRDGLELRDVVEHERGVRLAGGGERVLHAEVDLGGSRPEPRATARLQVGGLLDLGHAEAVAVEAAGEVLAARRAGDLDVVESHAGTRATTKIRRNGSTTP